MWKERKYLNDKENKLAKLQKKIDDVYAKDTAHIKSLSENG